MSPFLRKWHKNQFQITRLGWYFIAISLALGAAALRTSNNLLFLVLGGLLGTFLVNGILESLNLARIEVRRHGPHRAVQFRPFLMQLELINPKWGLSAYGIEIQDVSENGPMDRRCYFLRVAPKDHQTTSYRHAFVRRGKRHLEGVIVSTAFPFGLVRRSRFLALPDEVLVHPHPRPVDTEHMGMTDRWNAAFFPIPARWGSPRGLREYRPGDDPSTLHHKASAHLGTLVVREMEEESSKRVLLILDNALRPNQNESYLSALEAVEDTVGRATFLVSHFIQSGFQVAVRDRERRTGFGAGAAHRDMLLDFLALTPYADMGRPLPSRITDFPSTVVFLVDRAGVHRIDPGHGLGGLHGRAA